MSALVLKFLKPLAPYIAAAIIFIICVLYVLNLRHNLAAANTANAILVQTNQANLAAIADYKAQEQQWSTALAALDAQNLVTNTGVNRIIGNITNAPSSADAPVAPVLAQALADISKLQGQVK
jgi:DNA integrity scanning protein DisA with diadenylate cyclase activity